MIPVTYHLDFSPALSPEPLEKQGRGFQWLQWDGGVQAHQLPEVQRMPLESLCLSVKTCLPHVASIQLALARLLSPPTEQAVAAAVRSLTVGGIPGIFVLLRRAVPPVSV